MTARRTPAAAPTAASPGPHRGGPTDPSHDADLRRGILRTAVSRPVARGLLGAFLVMIYAVPAAQLARDKIEGDEPVLLDLFRRAPTRDNLRQLEHDLDEASSARAYVRPRVQEALTGWGGYGNSKATVGRGGWLFYAPGVAAVGGPSFLDPAVLEARRGAASLAGDPPVSPDPRPAILDFARYLGGRGIRLVLFPVPDKASLQPLELHGRARAVRAVGGVRAVDGTPPARNPAWPRLTAELAAAGVQLFDPSPRALLPGQPPRFLVQDTHWTPAWMETVARQLADLLVASDAVPPAPAGAPPKWRAIAKTVSRVGDVTDMLGLREGQTSFAPQTVTIHEVQDSTGTPFEPNQHARVLLLGDSFTNVFSLEQMGWGASAGLGAQLALALDRDVDVIAQNDSGAHATRELLFNTLAGEHVDGAGAGGDRLTGKTVVIWELASRELAVGDFKPVEWSRLARKAAP